MNQPVLPPKILDWSCDDGLAQTYACDFDLLITSGCSFTASTAWFNGPASWPGYVRDRCGINKAIDMSYPAMGNRYIADSVMYAVDTLCKEHTAKNPLVIVMWSGLDRIDSVRPLNAQNQGLLRLHDMVYQRIYENADPQSTTLQSYELMVSMDRYLGDKNISHVFSSYSNVLFPPFVPKRDTTNHFQDYLDQDQIKALQSLPWVPRQPMDFLYEWAWRNEYLTQGDHFHPPFEAHKAWTEEILLPGMQDADIIEAKS